MNSCIYSHGIVISNKKKLNACITHAILLYMKKLLRCL